MVGRHSSRPVMALSFGVLLAIGPPSQSLRRPSDSGGLVSIAGRVQLERGRVRFMGAAPAGDPIDMSADPYCREQHGSAVMDRPIRVGPAGGLGGVLVRVTNPPGSSTSAGEDALLDQMGCLYAPQVIALQVGQTLVIRNSDATLHNVRVEPTVNRGFNLGQPLAGIQSRRSFDAPEVGIPVRCDIHGWMTASIHVLDHEFFAVSGEDGSFEVPPLPPGDYEVEAWHPALGTSTRRVSVSGTTSAIDFEYPPPG